MKKLYTLVFLAVSSLAFSQQIGTINSINNADLQRRQFNGDILKHVPTPQSNDAVLLDYFNLDRFFFQNNGLNYNSYWWNMSVTSTTVTGGAISGAPLKSIVVGYDSLWGSDGTYIPTTSFSTMRIDTITFVYGYSNASGQADRLKISVIPIDNTGYPNISAVPLYTVAIDDGSDLLTNIVSGSTWIQSNPNFIQVPLNFTTGVKKFGLKFDFYGSNLDTFGLICGFGNNGTFCGTSNVSKIAMHTFLPLFPGLPGAAGNKANSYAMYTQYANYGLLPQSTGGDIYYDCDQSGGGTATAGDGFTYIQDWLILTNVTLDPLGVKELEKTGISLSQNVPNPFNGSTTVNYGIKEKNNVMLTVYDITGKQVMQYNEGSKLPGKYSVKIDGTKLAKGLYYYSLTAGDKTSAVKKMIITE